MGEDFLELLESVLPAGGWLGGGGSGRMAAEGGEADFEASPASGRLWSGFCGG